MRNGLIVALTSLLMAGAWGNTSSVLEETLYQNFKFSIQQNQKFSFNGLTSFDQSLYVDALHDLLEEDSLKAISTLEHLETSHYDLLQKFRLALLKMQYQLETKIPESLLNDLSNALMNPEIEARLIYTIAAHEKELFQAGHTDLIKQAQAFSQYNEINVEGLTTNHDVVRDLFNHRIDDSEGVTIYMFCRNNRLYPCLMAMRDIYGNAVRNMDGTLWTHMALAASSRSLPSHIRNGNTPAGVWKINSVMPYADQQLSFGQFRRMILEFIPKSKDENSIKLLLPESSHQDQWWYPSIIARDIGRNLFRIHGTGRMNKNEAAPFYPFLRTSGCIAQRENTYDDIEYQDQRELMDSIMLAMNLAPNYENETQIQGVLYLIEIDNQNSSVTEQDLIDRGIHY